MSLIITFCDLNRIRKRLSFLQFMYPGVHEKTIPDMPREKEERENNKDDWLY